jgi:hypothetical protein
MSQFYNINRKVILHNNEYMNVYTINKEPPRSSIVYNFVVRVQNRQLSKFEDYSRNPCVWVLCDRETREYCRTNEEFIEILFEFMKDGFKVNDELTKIYSKNWTSLKNIMIIEKN